jgi:hypothetical protein
MHPSHNRYYLRRTTPGRDEIRTTCQDARVRSIDEQGTLEEAQEQMERNLCSYL